MEISTKRNPKPGDVGRTIWAALAFATMLSGMSPAIARAEGDDRGQEDRGRHDQGSHHQQRGERESRGYGGYVYERPGDYYHAPPPVYYYQPPAPPPVIDFVFPLHIR